MENVKKGSEKIFIGFGIITIISGIALIFQKQLLIGIAGSVVGIWLVWQNWKQLKEKKSK
ncbi:MAG: hypothetical protein AAFZ15_21465 [Bacteroidota bacterium]